MWQFWWRVFKRANTETLQLLGFHSFQRFFVTAVVFILAILFIRLVGGYQQMNEEAKWIIAILAATGIVYLPLFIYNLLATPYRMECEANETASKKENVLKEVNKALLEQVATKKRRTEISNELAEIFQQATYFMSKKDIQNEDELKKWEGDVEKWENRIISYIEKNVSLSDARLMTYVKIHTSPKFGYAYNDLHNSELHFLSKRMEMLKEIIERYREPIN